MDRLSLFIHFPFTQSVQEAFPAIVESGLFSIHTLPIDNDLTSLLIECRPCVCLFPLNVQTLSPEIFEVLKTLKAERMKKGEPLRDPRFRLVMIAEERGFQADSWVNQGIHELIIAPIAPKALAHKLAKHYYKATTCALHAPTRPPPPPEAEEVWRPKQHQWRLLGERPVQSSAFQENPPVEKIVIHASIESLRPSDGEWEPDQNHIGDDERWTWKSNTSKRNTRWVYQGEKPIYDKVRRSWVFHGERPILKSSDTLEAETSAFETDEEKQVLDLKKEKEVKIIGVKKQLYRPVVKKARKEEDNTAEAATGSKKESSGIDAVSQKEAERISQFLNNWHPSGNTRLVEESGAVKKLFQTEEIAKKPPKEPREKSESAPPPLGEKTQHPFHHHHISADEIETKSMQKKAPEKQPIPGKNSTEAGSPLGEDQVRSRMYVPSASSNQASAKQATQDPLQETIMRILYPEKYPEKPEPPSPDKSGNQKQNQEVKPKPETVGSAPKDQNPKPPSPSAAQPSSAVKERTQGAPDHTTKQPPSPKTDSEKAIPLAMNKDPKAAPANQTPEKEKSQSIKNPGTEEDKVHQLKNTESEESNLSTHQLSDDEEAQDKTLISLSQKKEKKFTDQTATQTEEQPMAWSVQVEGEDIEKGRMKKTESDETLALEKKKQEEQKLELEKKAAQKKEQEAAAKQSQNQKLATIPGRVIGAGTGSGTQSIATPPPEKQKGWMSGIYQLLRKILRRKN